MTGARKTKLFTFLGIAMAALAILSIQSPALAVVKVFDGFGDADRNNDGLITSYDTDLNDSGTFNDPSADAALIARGITEVTAAEDPTDVGIIWSGIRSYDSAANLVKSKLRIIDDSVPVGSESLAEIHNSGLALGIESRGGGSSLIGRFGQSVELGPVAGDRLVVSVDWRVWREANDNVSQPLGNNELRWGLFQDTDGELGSFANVGENGASVEWGKDDGNWFANAPGAEGDKGIHASMTFGNFAVDTAARLRWEHNVAGINGTNPTASGSNGRILEGTGVTDTPGAGGDTATIASPPGDGTGGIISDLTTYKSHKLAIEIVRLANGLVQVASFIDNVEILRDEIKDTDTGYNVLAPIPFSYDYVAFRNATNDWDYVIDNFMVEVFGSNAGLAGDYNGDNTVDAADYALWRKNPGAYGGDPDGYTTWVANFGNSSGGGGSSSLTGQVPEPATVVLLGMCGLLLAFRRPSRAGA